jgi:2-phospho-L-lactate/phosphoenolpyruvate guanylyltransferase
MTIWAIVPVKPLVIGKSRLGSVLSGEERARLSRMLLERTLGVLKDSPSIDGSLVVSRDPEALAIAREFGCRTVLEHGQTQSDLNLALLRATAVAKAFEINGILVLPADLPLISPEDIQALVDESVKSPVVIIAPDRHNDGTNAMLMSPTGLIKFDYGPNSFNRHCMHALEAGAKLEIIRRINLGLDLDFPDDLDYYEQIQATRLEAR